MVDKEESRREHALGNGDMAGKELDVPPESTPPKVLLTQKAYVPWMAAAWAAAPLTFVVLLIYSMTDLPNQWGFHFAAWAKKGPLRLPMLGFSVLWIILTRGVYGIPIGNCEKDRFPEVRAYYPRTLWEAGRTSLAILQAASGLVMIYICQLVIFVEIFAILAK
ncbi:MAG: hypothetical protein NTW42_08165 [Deltaproteobacteria bacterium]|nr:hypothetical protein [Deltaproteobacteria bacterium]